MCGCMYGQQMCNLNACTYYMASHMCMTLEESILLLRNHKLLINSFFQLIAKSIIASNNSAKHSLERKIASAIFMAMPIQIDRDTCTPHRHSKYCYITLPWGRASVLQGDWLSLMDDSVDTCSSQLLNWHNQLCICLLHMHKHTRTHTHMDAMHIHNKSTQIHICTRKCVNICQWQTFAVFLVFSVHSTLVIISDVYTSRFMCIAIYFLNVYFPLCLQDKCVNDYTVFPSCKEDDSICNPPPEDMTGQQLCTIKCNSCIANQWVRV